jgi:stearoyl-CoA desaturase (Delta-9 desaturase)
MLSSLLDLPLWNLPWWQYVLITLVFTHITIASVTIFLHRHQAHRALELHPITSHFFRFWLWMTTGMVTKEWAAIHRKHHAKCETPEDPHSPQVLGIKKVFFEGSELYRAEARNAETLEKYGHGTPDDWLERNFYSGRSALGIQLMLVINVALFGPIGLTIWAVQMAWIPITAAGIINGFGHYWGYRNFACEDASTNISPWGILIGGEELHNNHHAYGTSAKLSNKWYEFDIGWMYIRIMETLGLAKVRKVAPVVKWQPVRPMVDLATVQAVITHRYDVMTRYAKLMNAQVKGYLPQGVNVATVREWLHLNPAELKQDEKELIEKTLAKNDKLAKLYQMRQELIEVWGRSTLTKEQLVAKLQDWCQKAEASGIEALREFSLRLKSYA